MVNVLHLGNNIYSGSIPRNARVTCETATCMCDYQESVTTGHTDVGQSYPYVPLCFTGDTKMDFLTGRTD